MMSLLYNLFHCIKSGKYSEYNNPQKFVITVANGRLTWHIHWLRLFFWIKLYNLSKRQIPILVLWPMAESASI